MHSDLPKLYTCAYIPGAELPSGVSAVSLYLMLKSSSLAHALRFPNTLNMRLYSSVVPSAGVTVRRNQIRFARAYSLFF